MKTRTVARASVLAALGAITIATLSWLPGGSASADQPYCHDLNCSAKPCDKRCRSDGGDQITCGEYIGEPCETPPTTTPPTPDPGPHCLPPRITTTLNPVAMGVAVILRASNASNDLLPYAFNWSFGDGVHSTAGLTVSHAFSTPADYTVYWEGWARCPDGTDKFYNTTLSLHVYNPDGPPGGGPAPCGPRGCLPPPGD